MTTYKIYRNICSELGIMFPLKEKELSVPVDPVLKDFNSLVYQLRNNEKIPLREYRYNINKALNEQSVIYYKIYRDLGDNKVYELSENAKYFSLNPSEHPNMYVDLHTIISILYISGFRGEELYSRTVNYLTN